MVKSKEYIERFALIDAMEAYQYDAGKDGYGIMVLIARQPEVKVVPVSELVELRDALYEDDQITMRGLERLNKLIGEYGGYNDE